MRKAARYVSSDIPCWWKPPEVEDWSYTKTAITRGYSGAPQLSVPIHQRCCNLILRIAFGSASHKALCYKAGRKLWGFVTRNGLRRSSTRSTGRNMWEQSIWTSHCLDFQPSMALRIVYRMDKCCGSHVCNAKTFLPYFRLRIKPDWMIELCGSYESLNIVTLMRYWSGTVYSPLWGRLRSCNKIFEVYKSVRSTRVVEWIS